MAFPRFISSLYKQSIYNLYKLLIMGEKAKNVTRIHFLKLFMNTEEGIAPKT